MMRRRRRRRRSGGLSLWGCELMCGMGFCVSGARARGKRWGREGEGGVDVDVDVVRWGRKEKAA